MPNYQVEPDDLFCFYCQKQYVQPVAFMKHVHSRHLGVFFELKKDPKLAALCVDIETRAR